MPPEPSSSIAIMKDISITASTANILKLIGIVLVLLYLMDIILLLSTADFQNTQWMLEFTGRLIDRGFVPMMGLGFLFAGFSFDGLTDSDTSGRNTLKTLTLFVSGVMCLLFVVLVPIHVNTTRTAVDAELQKITEQATAAETQLNAQVDQAKAQIDTQLQRIDEALKSGQLPPDQEAQAKQQQERLQKLKNDPKALNAEIAPQLNQRLQQIRSEREKLESQVQGNALRSGMRVGLGGAVLAISYGIITWTGLRRLS